MKQSKPHPAEVILAELMATTGWLDCPYLDSRCYREIFKFDEEIATYDALRDLRNAGLIREWMGEGSGRWIMTDEGRSLLCQRPPYNCYRAIRDALAAAGPMTASELEKECRNQASDYSPREFMLVLWDMIHSCMVIDVTESGDAHSSYDLPEHSE